LTAQKIRDSPDKLLRDRIYIRKIASGISKNICERLEFDFKEVNEDMLTNNFFKSKLLQQEEFIEISKQWTRKNAIPNTQWMPKYWDNHHSYPILKIDSHQLDANGKGIKKEPRYETLVPNLFLLSCNHYADIAADLLHANVFKAHQPSYKIKMPSSGLRFFVTCDGQAVDKHVTDVLLDAFQNARIKELKKRDTQGLPWRIMDTACMTWSDLRNNKSLFRSLRGLSRTHTRSLYKSATYRKGWIQERKEKHKDLVVKELARKLYESPYSNEVSTTCSPCCNFCFI